MKAIVITEPGGPHVLQLQDLPTPDPGPGEIRVRVAATAVNRADLLQRQGHYPAPDGAPSDVPGLEFSGTVDAVGGEAVGWREGDRVMGLLGGGGYAEYVIVDARHVVRVPTSMDLVRAAAIPEVFITAHDALRTRLQVQEGETLLIHAVGSGVGTAALQLARAWGLRTLGTSRTPAKLDRAKEIGLDVAIRPDRDDDGTPRFAEAVLDATEGRGVEAILDLVGGAYLPENLRSLASLGRQVVVGLTAGRTSEIDLGALLSKRLTLVGTVLRSRSAQEKAEAIRLFDRDVIPLLVEGRVEPVIDDVLPLTEAARAHERVGDNATFGKVLLRW